MSFDLKELYNDVLKKQHKFYMASGTKNAQCYEIVSVAKSYEGESYNIYFEGRPPLMNYTEKMASQANLIIRKTYPEISDLVSRKLYANSLQVGTIIALPEGFAEISSLRDGYKYMGYNLIHLQVDTCLGKRNIYVAYDDDKVMKPLCKNHLILGVWGTKNYHGIQDMFQMRSLSWSGYMDFEAYREEHTLGAKLNIVSGDTMPNKIANKAVPHKGIRDLMMEVRCEHSLNRDLQGVAPRCYATTGLRSLLQQVDSMNKKIEQKPTTVITKTVTPAPQPKPVVKPMITMTMISTFMKDYEETQKCTP